ncbi:SPOR domain-containing protein [Ferrovibrio sp.]|uniref:SPOR domain-containing protein n=1 Tax=Ferrovibrio sp. TaxID=1917215 RepID=UPI003D0A8C04
MSDLRTDRGSRPVPNAPAAAAGGPGSAKRMITAGIALGAVAAFGVGIWFAYDQGVKRGASGAPPLVRADQSPSKVAPENPGGMQVPNQDKQIYERLGNSTGNAQQQAEKLLPPPERPTANAPTVTPAPAGSAPAGASVTVPTRPAATAVPNQAPPNQTNAPTAPTAPRTAATPTTPAPAQQQPAARPAATPTAPATAPAAGGGSARVQLASLPEQAQAQSTWAALQKKFPGELGSLSASYERVDIPGKGVFFRVQAGPLRDRAAAQALCEKLSAQKQGCIVVAR